MHKKHAMKGITKSGLITLGPSIILRMKSTHNTDKKKRVRFLFEGIELIKCSLILEIGSSVQIKHRKQT